jgi:hypothetical protein
MMFCLDKPWPMGSGGTSVRVSWCPIKTPFKKESGGFGLIRKPTWTLDVACCLHAPARCEENEENEEQGGIRIRQNDNRWSWSENDNAVLENLLATLYQSEPTPKMFGFFGSEVRGLLATPKSEVHDRKMSYLTSLNVTAGLVLSSIAGTATSPPIYQNICKFSAMCLTF